MFDVVALLLPLEEPDSDVPDSCVAPVEFGADALSASGTFDVADVVVGATVTLPLSVVAACSLSSTVITSLLTAPDCADPDEPIEAGAVAAAAVLSDVADDALLAAVAVASAVVVCLNRLLRSAALVTPALRLDTDIRLLQSTKPSMVRLRVVVAHCDMRNNAILSGSASR